jgi:ABC-2 type transport system permease protein
MSKKFWLLLKTNLQLTFNAQRFFNRSNKPASKSKNALYAFFMLFLFASFLVLSGGFYFMLGSALAEINLIDLLIYLAITAYTVMILILSLFSANGYLFKAKDLQLMLSLPVSHFTVLSVKFFLQYVYELIFAIFILGPAFYVYFYYTSFSVFGIILAVICFFVSPLIPMSIGSLLSYFIGLVTRRLRKKNLFTILLSLVFIVGWMYISQNGQSIIAYVQENGVIIQDAIAKYYLPSSWLIGALNGDFVNFLLFAIVNLAVMFLVFAVISRKYSEIISILNTSGVRKRAKLDKLGQQNSTALGAMIKKELSMYFSSANYVLNTMLGSILLLVAAIAFMFMDTNTLFAAAEAAGFEKIGLVIAAGITMFTPSISPTTSSVISLEGKRLWIYKSIPAQTKDILKAKTSVNLFITLPFVVIADILFCIKFNLTVFDYLLLVVLGASFILLFSLSGIMINLAKPKLDFENEIMVIKQSASVMIQSFMGMGVMLALVLIYAFSGITNFYLFALSILIIIWAVIALLVYKLFSWGVERFNQL